MSVEPTRCCVRRVISGGQTGVDRGALEAAIELGMEHGGWCPRGRLAEDGVIPNEFDLSETRSAKYSMRTEQNVLDADATLILIAGELSGGTELTFRIAQKHRKPHLIADLRDARAVLIARQWLAQNQVEVLNVAGPRESSVPGIAREAREFVKILVSHVLRE